MAFQIENTFSCHEDWGKMSPSEKGRFCNTCQKEVIDFTVLSKSEIVEVFKQNNFQTLCARAEKSQLETIYIDSNIDNFTVKMPFWQKFLVILLVCFGPEMLNVQVVFSQDSLVEQTEILQDTIIVEDSLIVEVSDMKEHKESKRNKHKLIATEEFHIINGGFRIVDYREGHYFDFYNPHSLNNFYDSVEAKMDSIEERMQEFSVSWSDLPYPPKRKNAIEKLLFVPLTKETKQKYFDLKGK